MLPRAEPDAEPGAGRCQREPYTTAAALTEARDRSSRRPARGRRSNSR